MNITTHTVVKNEENWIWYSLMSVKDLVSEMLIIDDASTDKTVEVIRTIKDSKITLMEKRLTTPGDHTRARNNLVEKTKTDWFMLLDGDEIWNRETLKKFLAFLEKQPQDVFGVAMRTRNCVGDIYHYLPEDAGKYKILGREGHLTIRAYRKLPGRHWTGDYPLEKYCNDHLAFFDGFYWHMTHLPRSSSQHKVKGWRAKKMEIGIKVKNQNEFPEVFYEKRPDFVPDPWKKMSTGEKLIASVVTPIKKLRRAIKQ